MRAMHCALLPQAPGRPMSRRSLRIRIVPALRPLPLFLLIACGGIVAITVNLSKAAARAGIEGPIFAFALAAGSGLILLASTLAAGQRPRFDRAHVAYYLIAGLIGVAAPNLAAFAVAANAGASYSALSYSLSPIFTYAIAIVMGTDAPSLRRGAGLLLGFLGTVAILHDMVAGAAGAGPFWALAALSVPALLAAGNVYRSLRWPRNAEPLTLAAMMMLSAALWTLPALIAMAPDPAAAEPGGWAMVAAQIALSALLYWLFFHLQREGGPVFLSQMGYVVAALGVPIAVFFFHESVSALVVAGLAAIVAGVVLVTPRP